MAISEDASTPAVVTSAADTTGIITSASFSPPAGSLLVVLAAITFNGGSQASSATVKDSASNTFTAGPSVNTSGHDTNAGIWTRYYSSAPGSITVTVTDTNTAQAARMLAVRVVNGAASSQSGAGSATTSAAPGDNATHDCTGNITTTAAGSWVYAVVADGTNAGSSTVTPDSGTATLPGGVLPWNDATDEVTSVAGTQSPQATGTPGSTPVGWTISATYWWAWAALEILPASATTASAGLAAATGTAQRPVPDVLASAGKAAGTGAALQPAFIYAPAGLAAGTGTALQPSVSTSGNTTAAAGLAAGTGAAQQPSVSSGTLYQYLGQEACTYLDYLDLGTGHVLSPVPGNSYSMAVASGRNAGLTVPPPGRPWNPGNPGAGGTFAPLLARGAPAEDHAAVLARGRAHTSALHAAWARGILRPGQPLSGDDHQRLGCCGGREDQP